MKNSWVVILLNLSCQVRQNLGTLEFKADNFSALFSWITKPHHKDEQGLIKFRKEKYINHYLARISLSNIAALKVKIERLI